MPSRIIIVSVLLLFGAQSAAAHDLPDGEHVVTLPDGAVYEGRVVAGRFAGEGKLVHSNGDVFVGHFAAGRIDGPGTYNAANGDVYHGMFFVSQQGDGAAGEGVIRYADGATYEGPWADWQPHGAGTFVSDGTTYEGVFAQGSPQGEFVISYEGGASYRGGYDDWTYQGSGVYATNDGTAYSGEFEDGELRSPATIVQADGTEYVGDVSYWRYHGEGALTTADGDVYEGAFSNGRYHGEGRLDIDNGQQVITGRWRNGWFVGPDVEAHVRDGIGEMPIEATMYAQPEQMNRVIASIPAGRPEITEVYSLVFAAYGAQDVFRREADLFRDAAARKFPNEVANIGLVNNRSTVLDVPLANKTNLERMLNAIGQQMNTDDDVLFVYITSHGAKDGTVSVQMPGIRFEDLSGAALSQMLDAAGIKWRVIVVSACYSGALIPLLADAHTLIMTSARADRTSFGCSNESDATYFGKALMVDADLHNGDLEASFYQARRLVRDRELEQNVGPFSEPQIHVGREIRKKLADLNPFPTGAN